MELAPGVPHDPPMLSRLVYSALGAFALPALARRLSHGAVILCYHNVVEEPAASSGEPSLHLLTHAFERQMQWLVRHYQVIPLRDLVERLERRRPLRRCAAVTFDDAYVGVFRHAWPVLRELQIPATVFVVANAPAGGMPFWWDHPAVQAAATPQRRRAWLAELRGDGASILRSLGAGAAAVPSYQQPADWETIGQAARAGLALGIHTSTHRALPTLSDDELTDELHSSREIVARETGSAPECFAYPYGAWDHRVRDAVRAAGYRAAVTLDYRFIRAGTDPLSLGRVNVPAGISPAAYDAWLAGLRLRLPTARGADPLLEPGKVARREAPMGWERA